MPENSGAELPSGEESILGPESRPDKPIIFGGEFPDMQVWGTFTSCIAVVLSLRKIACGCTLI